MRSLLRWSQAALVSLLVLIFLGAIVRATGSGLGCPDWPKCWACLIPPTSVDKVDFDKIDLERFKKKAERAGRNPDEITRESLRDEFNPMHTWIEFINRLFALPMALTSVVAFIAALLLRPPMRLAQWMTGLSVLTVFVNAWMGARVVYSGLKPGVITTHLALAFLLMIFLIVVIAQVQGRLGQTTPQANRLTILSAVTLFACLLIEGLIGAQLREMTDELAKSHYGEPRISWTYELQESWKYYVHRSFSWSALVAIVLMMLGAKSSRGYCTILEWGMLSMVLMLMVMGIVLGHYGIFPVVQVLHVGVAALLFCAVTYWIAAQVFLSKK